MRAQVTLSGAAQVGAALGLVVMLAGTFAPWLRSGSVERNSYRAEGLIQRLLGVGGAAGFALNLWPMLGLICALAAVSFWAGLRRTSALAALCVSAFVGVVCAALMFAPSSHGVAVVRIGPMICGIGASISALFLAVLLISLRRTAITSPGVPR